MARAQPEASVEVLVAGVGAEAVACLWGALAGFVALGPVPRGWGSVPLVHPFLGCSADGCILLNGPYACV